MTALFAIEAFTEGQPTGAVQLAEGASLEVGRQGSGLAIGDQSLSSRHFRLSLAGGVLGIEDLGSTNGTWLGDAQVTQAVQVAPGSRIMAGNTTFLVKSLGGAGYVEGTRWRYLGVPDGMQAQPQFGFSGENSPEFKENVMCREDPLPADDSIAAYAQRQFERLKMVAPDLRRRDFLAPPELIPGENLICDVALTYERNAVTQLHAYVRAGSAVGIAVWTYRAGQGDALARFWTILSALRFGG